jgi:hypothetical protein
MTPALLHRFRRRVHARCADQLSNALRLTGGDTLAQLACATTV